MTPSVLAVAERLRGRRVLAIGTGTSWHAASQAAVLLRAAGVDACAVQSADAAVDGPLPGSDGALLAFSHTGAKRYTAQAVQRARSRRRFLQVRLRSLPVPAHRTTSVRLFNASQPLKWIHGGVGRVGNADA
jgi:fructoselysine-6-P-deglycase FrlB-like protein